MPTGKRPLRLLIVEDMPDDAELLLLALRGSYDVTWFRVETAEGMQHALDTASWDVIISDYSMPTFDAPSALRLLAATGLDIPCLVVSGTVGEESAVEALRGGAKDFLVKGRFSRLVASVQRELDDVGARASQGRADRKLEQSEAGRSRSEEQARMLLDSTVEGILGVDPEGRCTFANDSCIRQLLEPGLLEGADVHDSMHGAPEGGREACALCLAGRGQYARFMNDVVLTRADGTTFAADYRVVPLKTDDLSRGAVISFVDITERKRIEEQLRLAQKMDAIGRLAGGIAHDFNNVLSVILSYASLLEDSADTSVRADAEEITKAAMRAADLTKQLLAFGRQQILEPMVLDVNPITERMDKMLRRLLPNDVELSLVLAPQLGMVRADPSTLEQIIMNLVVNARDAMDGGGTLTIETSNVVLDDEYCERHLGVSPGAYVMMAFTDTGCGMDPATLARIFEPFFTTKATGKGTGLGLSTVFGIVKQSGGHIWVYSEPNAGTSFRVYLPRCDGPVAALAPQLITALDRRGNEILLLVDDEDQVRQVTKTILELQGYQVIEARDGAEALRLCERSSATIDLLVTDVVMPGMGGRELADRLVLLRPAVKVLFLSGYTEKSIVDHGVLHAGLAFLGKPVTRQSLLHKVRAVLDG